MNAACVYDMKPFSAYIKYLLCSEMMQAVLSTMLTYYMSEGGT